MKIDGAILVDDPADAGPLAARLEAAGYDGGFTFEGQHDPFLPLAVAAQQTERLELATAIAVGFARSPMTLANTAYDLQRLSRGRFILGLGTQIRPHIERRFSMPWSRPAPRMREMILATRAILMAWQEGSPLDFRGEFYQHTLMTPVFDPGPNPHGVPPIFCAGVGARMTEVAGEVADGFLVHPFHTLDFFRDEALPALARGRERAGRTPEDCQVSCQVIVATGRNDEELEGTRNGARAQISFYGSTPAYRPVLESVGRGELQDELRRLSKEGRWLEMAGRIDDDLLERIAVVAPRDQLAARIRERYGGLVDRVSLVAPFAPDPELLADVVAGLRAG
ncbi:MAG: LLM class F420-dependent oxidoreductase [Myxococcales bacterium]|nr:LLM class F420-dependent oxidoreductase [Myxococcales bacterium]